MLVSVLMSVYMEEISFLREAIESILNQTYTDFEFIIVGDTPISNRECIFGVIEEYASKDSRIKFIPNENNIGLTKSLNVGLNHCSGKYIARIDADDVSNSDRIEKQVDFLERNGDIAVCGTNVIFIDENGKELGHSDLYCDAEGIKASLLFQTQIFHPTVMFRRIISGKTIYYDEKIKYAQDYALWARLITHRMGNLKEALVKYRLSSKQITNKNREEQITYSRLIQRTIVNQLNLNITEYHFQLLSSLIYNRHVIRKESTNHVFDMSRCLLDKYNQRFTTRGKYICKDWLTIYTLRFLFEKHSRIEAFFLHIYFRILIRNFSPRRIGLLLYLTFCKKTNDHFVAH